MRSALHVVGGSIKNHHDCYRVIPITRLNQIAQTEFMPLKTAIISGLSLLLACFLTISSHAADSVDQTKIKETVDQTIRPLMSKYKIPGMAVGVTINGKSYVHNYGVASRETKQPVTDETLFEIGSLSKAFTAALTAYAQVKDDLSLSDSASKDYPSLRGSSFDKITLLNLGTHTAGGLPLQVPDNITNTDQLTEYFKHWKPTYAPGTHRLYSNPSVGLLGMIAAKSLHEPFDDAIEKTLFPALGMTQSYINVPTGQLKNYAQGYTDQDAPVRMKAGVLASEAYGVKSIATDMIRFIDANVGLIALDGKWQRAITDTHGVFPIWRTDAGLDLGAVSVPGRAETIADRQLRDNDL